MRSFAKIKHAKFRENKTLAKIYEFTEASLLYRLMTLLSFKNLQNVVSAK